MTWEICPTPLDVDPPWDTMGYGQQVGGAHPTGMHSCFMQYHCTSQTFLLDSFKEYGEFRYQKVTILYQMP